MRQFAIVRTVVVGGSVLECLFFGGLAVYTLRLGITLNGRVDALANDLNFLAAALLLAIVAALGSGAFLMSSMWVGRRIVGGRIIGASLHLVATAVAAWAAIWLGLSDLNADPTTVGYWSPWISFAVAAVVILIGFNVLASLFLPAGRDG